MGDDPAGAADPVAGRHELLEGVVAAVVGHGGVVVDHGDVVLLIPAVPGEAGVEVCGSAAGAAAVDVDDRLRAFQIEVVVVVAAREGHAGSGQAVALENLAGARAVVGVRCRSDMGMFLSLMTGWVPVGAGCARTVGWVWSTPKSPRPGAAGFSAPGPPARSAAAWAQGCAEKVTRACAARCGRGLSGPGVPHRSCWAPADRQNR